MARQKQARKHEFIQPALFSRFSLSLMGWAKNEAYKCNIYLFLDFLKWYSARTRTYTCGQSAPLTQYSMFGVICHVYRTHVWSALSLSAMLTNDAASMWIYIRHVYEYVCTAREKKSSKCAHIPVYYMYRTYVIHVVAVRSFLGLTLGACCMRQLFLFVRSSFFFFS